MIKVKPTIFVFTFFNGKFAVGNAVKPDELIAAINSKFNYSVTDTLQVAEIIGVKNRLKNAP